MVLLFIIKVYKLLRELEYPKKITFKKYFKSKMEGKEWLSKLSLALESFYL